MSKTPDPTHLPPGAKHPHKEERPRHGPLLPPELEGCQPPADDGLDADDFTDLVLVLLAQVLDVVVLQEHLRLAQSVAREDRKRHLIVLRAN